MNAQPRAPAIFIIATYVCFAIGFRANAQPPSGSQKETVVSNLATGHATGTFEVKVTPQTSDDSSQDAMLGRMSLDKQFHGDLQGASKGQMLTAGTPRKGPARHVAPHHLSRVLPCRSGTFILPHNGTITRRAFQLSITL